MIPRDPRRLYSYSAEPPPVLADYRRSAARAGVAIALSGEGVVTILILALGKGLALTGLVDGIDEFCSCVALIAGGVLSFAGWSIGASIGTARFYQAQRDWEARQQQAQHAELAQQAQQFQQFQQSEAFQQFQAFQQWQQAQQGRRSQRSESPQPPRPPEHPQPPHPSSEQRGW